MTDEIILNILFGLIDEVMASKMFDQLYDFWQSDF
jgi:hypothetical protein